MTAANSLKTISERWNLLKHPFYTRWKAGELTRDELADYAGQYAHVVRALPGWLESGGEDLRGHAAEEASHVALWERFGEGLGMPAEEIRSAPANRATAALLESCRQLSDAGHGAEVVWAFESQSPAVSAEKLTGLRAHYGIDEYSGGEYFALHANLDVEHEAELRPLVRDHEAVKTVMRGLWDLLSSAERAA